MKRLLTLSALLSFSSVAWCIDLTKSPVNSAVATINAASVDIQTVGISILLIITIIAGYKLLRKSL